MRIEKIVTTVLDEVRKRQVEEIIDVLSDGLEEPIPTSSVLIRSTRSTLGTPSLGKS